MSLTPVTAAIARGGDDLETNAGDPSAVCVTVVRRAAKRADVLRLTWLFWRSADVAEYQGPLMRAAGFAVGLVRILPPRRHTPTAILTEHLGRISGGVLLSSDRCLETLVVDKSHPARHESREALAEQVQAMMATRAGKDIHAWTVHPAVLHEAPRLGLRPEPCGRYVVTIHLGVLRFSVHMRRPRSWSPLVSATRVYYLRADIAACNNSHVSPVARSRRPRGRGAWLSVFLALGLLLTGCGTASESTTQRSRTQAPVADSTAKAPPSAAIPRTAVGRQAGWLFAASAHAPVPEAEVRAHFDEAFLEQVSPAALNQVLARSTGLRLIAIVRSEPRKLVVTASTAGKHARFDVLLEIDDHGLIESFAVRPARTSAAPQA